MFAAAWRHPLFVPELHVCERRALPTRTGALRCCLPGTILYGATCDRAAGHPAGNRNRTVSRSGFGARMACIAYIER